MSITALPTPPSRQDPVNFAVRGDAFMAALPVFATEANALAVEMEAAAATAASDAVAAAIAATSGSFVNTSSTQTVGGVKTFTSSPVMPGNATTALQAVPLQQAQALAASSLPTGALINFPATVAPAGFIKRNGALLSRTTYAALWAFAQASGNLSASDGVWQVGQFSPGDGSTTFRIPDGRGEIDRGWDDGRGVDSGRGIGTFQGDQNKSHNHGGASGTQSADHAHSGTTSGQSADHTHGYDRQSDGHNASAGPAGNYVGDAKTVTATGGASTDHSHGFTTGGVSANHSHTISSDGGTEVRMRNVAVLAAIKY